METIVSPESKSNQEKMEELSRLFPVLSGAYAPATGGIDAELLLGAVHEFFFDQMHGDDRAVIEFSLKMSAKLKYAREVKGRGGWEDKTQCTAGYLSELLREHVKKGDPVDVANLAMMLSMRDESIVQ